MSLVSSLYIYFNIFNGIFFLVVYCSGLQITLEDFSVEPTIIEITFNNIPGLYHSVDFLGYAILFKKTDAEEWWQVRYKRGGGGRTYIFKELRPYVNYTFRVSPYGLKAAGLAGPPQTIQTKEDSKWSVSGNHAILFQTSDNYKENLYRIIMPRELSMKDCLIMIIYRFSQS